MTIGWIVGAVALVATQDCRIVVDAVAEPEGAPETVTCGALPVGMARGGTRFVDVRVRGARGAGVIVARCGGAVLHATFPDGVPAGRHPLDVRDAAAFAPAGIEAIAAGHEVLVTHGGVAIALDASGAVTGPSWRCAPWPPPRPGAWKIADEDPGRVVARFGAPGGAGRDVELFATFRAGAPEADLVVIARDRGDGPRLVGVRLSSDETEVFEAASGATESREVDLVPPKPFDAAVGAVLGLEEEAVVDGPDGVSAIVRRHGAVAPERIVKIGPRASDVILSGESSGGGPRVLRIRCRFGPGGRRLLARPSSPEVVSSGVRFAPIGGRRDLIEASRKLDAAVAAFLADPRHGLLHGMRDAPDWRLDAGRVGNLEWDTAFGFYLRHRERGDPRDAGFAISAVEHLVAADRDPDTGLFFQHGRAHQSGVVEAGHHWADGLACVAAWTDDPWLCDAAKSLANDQIRAFRAFDLESAAPRSLGWALTALCALHPCADDPAASLAAIRRIETHLRRRQHTSGHLMLEPALAREGARRISPFVDGGIVAPALERAAAVLGDPRCRAAARRLRAALVRDAVTRTREATVLASSVLVDERSGRPVLLAGVAEGEEILLFLGGVAGTDRAIEAALLATASRTLRLEARTFLGKPISIALRALPAYAGRPR